MLLEIRKGDYLQTINIEGHLKKKNWIDEEIIRINTQGKNSCSSSE